MGIYTHWPKGCYAHTQIHIKSMTKLPKSVKLISKCLTIAASIVAFAVSARAVPTLYLYDWYHGVLVTVVDGGVSDRWAGPNVVLYNGTVGNWTVNVSTGIVLGTPTQPEIDLNSVNMSNGAGKLSIVFSADGFGPTQGSVVTEIGGTTAGTVKSSTWADSNDIVPFVTSPLPGNFFGTKITGWSSPFGPGAFSNTSSGSLLLGAYSLSTVIEITHTHSGISSFDSNVTVPDSAMTAWMLSLGLFVVGLVARRRKG
jgi:hypothetical protein